MGKQYTVGTEVTCNGFPGTISKICEWSRATSYGVEDVMVEVRLERGTVCVSLSELSRFDRVAA